MGFSIQDNLKKINSGLTLAGCLSLLVTAFFLVIFFLFLYQQKIASNVPIQYLNNNSHIAILEGMENRTTDRDPRPFASIKGKTYTFAWCQGSGNIKVSNRVYFATEDEAKKSGRTFSKLCKR